MGGGLSPAIDSLNSNERERGDGPSGRGALRQWRARSSSTAVSRRLEVVRLVAVGRTNREIAAELFLSPRTVDMHVRNLLRKLDCRSRVEAAHRAGELDLLA
jgi:DNA-binding NarL/FixJ family response regulator